MHTAHRRRDIETLVKSNSLSCPFYQMTWFFCPFHLKRHLLSKVFLFACWFCLVYWCRYDVYWWSILHRWWWLKLRTCLFPKIREQRVEVIKRTLSPSHLLHDLQSHICGDKVETKESRLIRVNVSFRFLWFISVLVKLRKTTATWELRGFPGPWSSSVSLNVFSGSETTEMYLQSIRL